MKIAIVQIPPVFNNLEASLEKAQSILESAKKEKADLIVFGENWLCGYPAWIDYCTNVSLWDDPVVKNIWAEMFENSLTLDSPEFHTLQAMIKESGAVVVMGANESITEGKGNGSIYNSCFIFGKDGEVLNHHRKLVPTYGEKLVHAAGDGHGLKSVDTNFGKLGALICWEHWMPITRQVMHDEAEDLHIALWPMVKEMNIIAARQYAFEGRCHVVSVGTVMPLTDTPDGLTPSESTKGKNNVLEGGSCIVAPNGEIILQPQYGNSEIIYHEIENLKSNIAERMNLAVSGNYQRYDVFDLKVNKERPF